MRVVRFGIVFLLAIAACRDPFAPAPSPSIEVYATGANTSPCPNRYHGCKKPVKYLGPRGECEVFSCGHGKRGAYMIRVSAKDTEALRELHALAGDE